MSQIEKLARPVLTPLIKAPYTARTLSEDDCVCVALWAAVKSVVVDHYAVKEHGFKPFFTPQERTALRDHWRPPRRMRAWIGRLSVQSTNTGFARSAYSVFGGRQPIKHLTAYAFTLSALELVIQTISVKNIGRPKFGSLDYIPEHEFTVHPKRGKWDDYLINVLPDVGEIAWPPQLQFGKDGFEFLAHRISGRPIH
jgi:hypothetical protein